MTGPLTETLRLKLPDRAGPYRWSPEVLAEPGVRLVRLIHNGVTQPRRRKDVEAMLDGTWPYRVSDGAIIWSCYEWLAPKTHKIKIEVDRSAQALMRLVAWMRQHPDALASDAPLAAAREGCEDPWVRKLTHDPGFETSFELIRLLAGSR